MTDRFRTGDPVTLAYAVTAPGGVAVFNEVDAEVLFASGNGRSLFMVFDARIGKHAGAMPVLLEDDGAYRSIIDGTEITLKARESADG